MFCSSRIEFLTEKEKLLLNTETLEQQYLLQIEWLDQLSHINVTDANVLEHQLQQCKVSKLLTIALIHYSITEKNLDYLK